MRGTRRWQVLVVSCYGQRRSQFKCGVSTTISELKVDLLLREIAPTISLEADHDGGQSKVTILLQLGENTGLEEDLALTNAVELWAQLEVLDHQLGCLATIHETLKCGQDKDVEVCTCFTLF